KPPEPGTTRPTVPLQAPVHDTDVTAPSVPLAPAETKSAPELQIHRKLKPEQPAKPAKPEKPPKPPKPAKKTPVEVVEVPKPVSEPPPVIGRSPEELK